MRSPSERRVTVECECRACGGTGLYVGMCERDGAAIICSPCKGTGKSKITYTPFEGRREPPEGVTRVFVTNPGIRLNPSETSGGVSLENWLLGADPGVPGCEARGHSCPLLWYQSVDPDKKPDWEGCVSYGVALFDCPFFDTKSSCWAKWDKERGEL